VQGERPWQNYHVGTLFIGVFTTLCIASLIGMIVARSVFGLNEKSDDYMFILQVAFTVSVQIGSLVWVHLFLKNHGIGWKEGFGLGRRNPLLLALLGFAACLLFLPVAWLVQQLSVMAVIKVNAVTSINVQPKLQEVVMTLNKIELPVWKRVYFALAAVVFAPVFEEIIFPGHLGDGGAVWPVALQSHHLHPAAAVQRAVVLAVLPLGQPAAAHLHPCLLQPAELPVHHVSGRNRAAVAEIDA
jgi:membrane protease YdiL (CAAX protease family)